MPLELSVEELWEKALGKPSSSGSRAINLVVEPGPLRVIPSCVVETAQKYLAETDDVEKVLRYIENAFYIYRATVCEGFAAPHYRDNGTYEWPPAAKFSWSNIEAVILGGEFIEGPIPKESSSVVIKSRTGNKTEETKIELREGETYEETKVRDIIPGKEDLPKILKYKIVDLEKAGLVFSQSWQQLALRNYANPIYQILKDLLIGKLPLDEARNYLQSHLSKLSQEYSMPVGRYKRGFEEANSGTFFFVV